MWLTSRLGTTFLRRQLYPPIGNHNTTVIVIRKIWKIWILYISNIRYELYYIRTSAEMHWTLTKTEFTTENLSEFRANMVFDRIGSSFGKSSRTWLYKYSILNKCWIVLSHPGGSGTTGMNLQIFKKSLCFFGAVTLAESVSIQRTVSNIHGSEIEFQVPI